MNRDLEAEARISAEAALLGLDFEWSGDSYHLLFEIHNPDIERIAYVDYVEDSRDVTNIEYAYSNRISYQYIRPKRLSSEECFYRMVHAMVLHAARRK